ncbi:MAG: hypothetical protein Q8P41_16900 [Pseudomonadota bacterium]|nr:hypothetical protein [Pseudomonadota bacterium]
MRVLVVHHGRLPTPGSRSDAPVTGGARRAAVHVAALRGAGHDVLTLARDQDDADPRAAGVLPGFRSPGDLRRLAAAAAPDWILCVAPEEAPALAPVAPLVVDLYAPRVLEAAFEGLQREEAGRALAAIEAADEVLFSNPRQRWLWTGLLGAGGWDLARPAGLLVPLAALPGPARRAPERPTFVIGGRPWPWLDATDTLRRAVATLGTRVDIVSVGLSPVDGVRALPAVSLDAWLDLLAGATAALDRYAPNPERALALSFRQMDYLGAGLPLVSDADTPLADAIRETRAGWVDEPLEDALEAALAAPRASAALAARYAPAVTEAPLLAWIPRRRDRPWSFLGRGARVAGVEGRAAVDRAARAAAEAELARKRTEVDGLHGQLRALTTSVEALSVAMHDVAGLRRETVAVLGTRLNAQTDEAEHLRRELAIAHADLDKKNLELGRLQQERDRLGRAFTLLRPNRG